MKLTIFSLSGIEFEGEAQAFNVKTADGEITVLDHHRPLISILVPGRANIMKPDGRTSYFDISSGFLEMNDRNELNILAS